MSSHFLHQVQVSAVECDTLDFEEFCDLDAAASWSERRSVGRHIFLVFDGWVASCSPSGDCAIVSTWPGLRTAA